MIDHLWAPNRAPGPNWVHMRVPQAPAVAVVHDPDRPAGIRAVPAPDEAIAAEALAVFIERGPDTFVVTRGRLNGRPVAGGIALLHHQDALCVEAPGEAKAPLTLFACMDGLVEVFEYAPASGRAIAPLCAMCGLPLEPGERVQRACPAAEPPCAALIHEECSSSRCPVCQQEITDPTGESTIWVPGN